MEDMDKKLLEKLSSDFHKISSKEGWEPCDITLMKDLEKLMYYIEVRDAMKKGEKSYPGAEYIDDEMSYRGRDSMGRFTSGRGYNSYSSYDDYGDMNSRRGMRGRGSGMMEADPWYYDRGGNSGRRYYDDGGSSGRRYYDSEKDNTVNYLHRLMDSENRPEIKTAMQNVIRELEAK